MTGKSNDTIKEKYLVAFDIGCTFKTTLNNSSLGSAFRQLGSRVCVNAFHGYSHAYPCQLENHPNVIEGIGLEDLETLERIFSQSNQLAPVTRYASAYRRHALIDLYFKHWDSEKYGNLGLMLYNNYRQAVDIINTKTPILQESLTSLQMTREQLQELESEERQYFATLRDEAPWDLHAVAYVEALQDLQSARYDTRPLFLIVSGELTSPVAGTILMPPQPVSALPPLSIISGFRRRPVRQPMTSISQPLASSRRDGARCKIRSRG